MLLVRTEKLPEGNDWLYESNLDGYRSIAGKPGTHLLRQGLCTWQSDQDNV